MTPEDRKAYEAHKSGARKLQPFYERLMADILAASSQRIEASDFLEE